MFDEFVDDISVVQLKEDVLVEIISWCETTSSSSFGRYFSTQGRPLSSVPFVSTTLPFPLLSFLVGGASIISSSESRAVVIIDGCVAST